MPPTRSASSAASFAARAATPTPNAPSARRYGSALPPSDPPISRPLASAPTSQPPSSPTPASLPPDLSSATPKPPSAGTSARAPWRSPSYNTTSVRSTCARAAPPSLKASSPAAPPAKPPKPPASLPAPLPLSPKIFSARPPRAARARLNQASIAGKEHAVRPSPSRMWRAALFKVRARAWPVSNDIRPAEDLPPRPLYPGGSCAMNPELAPLGP